MAKKRLASGYTFTAAAKTISHADFSDITLAGIQVIVNVTDQIIIYNFADTTKGGTLATDTLTLEYDTTTMSDTDELMILVEDGVASQAITAASLPLPTGAATLAEQQTQSASLSVLDDWDETDRAKVNLIVGQAGIAAGTGVDGVTVPRVSLATNVALPAGTNNIGDVDVASIAAGDNNIGNVDVVTVNGVAPAFGSGVRGATVQRVTVATDDLVPVSAASLPLPTGAATSALQTQPGVDIGDVTINNAAGASAVNIQDGGNSITVDGTLTVTNGGTFAVQDSQTITDNGAFTDGTSKVFTAGFIYDEVAGTALTENDAAAARINVNRAQVHAIEDGVTRGRYMTVTASNAAKVDGSAVTQPISASSLPLPTGASTLAEQQSQTTALQIMDDWDETDRAKVNIIVGQAGVAAGAGAVGVTVPRVTLASDDPAVVALQLLDNAVSGAGFNITQVNGEAVDVGAGTEAAAIRVTLPTNGTGILAGVTTVTTLTGTTTLTPGTGATNLGKAIDTAGGATDTGVAELAIRDDALATLTPVDGDYVANRVNARGAKWVAIEDGAGGQITSFGGGTEVAEDTAHSTGVLGGVPMFVRRDTPTALAGADNDYIPPTTDANGAQWVSLATKLDATNDTVGIGPQTTGGLTTYHLVSAATTNATNIKASAGQLYGWYIYNSNAAARKVAFHNSASTPTAGASVFFSLVIPPSSGANVFSAIGIPFSSGIGITTVTGLADSDSAAVAANDLIINLFYK